MDIIPRITFLTQNVGTCTTCPAGYSCTDSDATPCTTSGDYSPVGNSSCIPCPIGKSNRVFDIKKSSYVKKSVEMGHLIYGIVSIN